LATWTARLVGDGDVDRHRSASHVHRADFLGAHDAEPRRPRSSPPAIPMFEPAVAMITSQQPSRTAFPAKQRPG
jgi:hypothetical protein